jgi:serine/threonine protein kinase
MVHAKQMNSKTKKFGRYELIGFLGGGGMGQVYLATDPRLDRNVALKIPNPEKRQDERWQRMFYEEARAMAQIRHTNLCPVYEAGSVDGVDYLAMAYIKGPSIADLLRDANAPSPQQSLLALGKLSLGIHTMHRAGVIHRDLKPGNVIIDSSGEPVVVDFGLACRDADVSSTDMVVGSCGFLAPEIISSNGRDIGPQSDIYALGTIGYLLLTGKMPYTGSATKIYREQLKLKPIPPSVLRPGLDPEIDAVIGRTLEADPSKRYQTARQLANDINQLMRKQSAQASYKQFDIQVIQGCHVIHLHNESLLSMAELERTKREIFAMIAAEKPLRLILNFAAVQRCSSAAISVMTHLYLDLKATRTQLMLCGIREAIRAVFVTMNLDGTVFRIFETVPHALRAVEVD